MNKDLQIAKKTVQTEIQALKKLGTSFGRSSQFSKAVSLITKIKGKCLVIGVGKSYLVGLKTSATLSAASCNNITDSTSSPLSSISCFASVAFVPCNLTIRGTLISPIFL